MRTWVGRAACVLALAASASACRCPDDFPTCYSDGDCVVADCASGCAWEYGENFIDGCSGSGDCTEDADGERAATPSYDSQSSYDSQNSYDSAFGGAFGGSGSWNYIAIVVVLSLLPMALVVARKVQSRAQETGTSRVQVVRQMTRRNFSAQTSPASVPMTTATPSPVAVAVPMAVASATAAPMTVPVAYAAPQQTAAPHDQPVAIVQGMPL
jgi:hypothetical protein